MEYCRNLIAKQPSHLRLKRGLSQRELAEQLRECGCTFDYMDIVMLESNRASITDMELKQLVDFFHTTYDYLIEGKKTPSGDQ